MIDATTTVSSPLPTPSTKAPSEQNGGFDAALQAAQKAEAAAEAHRKERDAIAEKGFSAWVRDTRIEALKEKLKRKVMAEMGLDADSIGRLDAAMRQILEQKIEEEVSRRLAEETAKEDEQHQRGNQAKTAQGGASCPVIPALAWPGGASLF